MDRFSFAMFAATCTVMASLLLLDATGLMALESLADRALQIASAGMMVGLAAWAVAVLVGRD